MNFKIMTGDNRETLKTLGDNSVDAIVTDPPYGIDFLGKTWDANTGALETYAECLRVLKPGGYILAFSAARTYHHLAITLEQAGFEIRDQLMWLYASGFPKAQDIGKAIDKRAGKGKEQTIRAEYNGGKHGPKSVDLSMQGARCPVCKRDSNARYNCDKGQECGMVYKPQTPEAQQWSGWKTALKPAHEPICMARKPFKGSTVDNVLEVGLGALNIDATRIETDDVRSGGANGLSRLTFGEGETSNEDSNKAYTPSELGRFPSNVIGAVEGYQKFFYCPKVSRKERHTGFEQLPPSAGTTQMYGPEQAVTRNTSNMGGDKKGKNAKGGKHDPLGHIAKNPEGMWDDGVQFQERKQKQDPLGHIPAPFGDVKGAYVDGERMAKVADDTGYANVGNNHPTVKPVALMRYLIKLVTPPNSTVLDPFSGSGSTGMAAVELGHEFIGCELDENYVRIAETRIRAWNTPEDSGTTYENLFEEKG